MTARPLIAGTLALLLPACFPRVDWVDTGELHDADGDGAWDHEDCAPDDPGVHPGAAEFCNGVDDDCDGLVDDDDGRVLGTTRWAPDEDGDGYGSSSAGIEACEQPSGHVGNAWDCDDADPTVSPAATEICDGVDNDCDRRVDVDAEDALTWYLDDDGDGCGQDAITRVACEQPTGFVATGGDCDDASADVHPGAGEVCDGVDNDCDSALDEDVVATFYRDRDGDGWGDPEVFVAQCPAPSGYVADGLDCDDDAGDVHPGADERCDGVDHDCDGVALEDDSLDASTWYRDADGDGVGDPATSTTACAQPSGYGAEGTDCDDHATAVHPGAYDLCGVLADGIDDDCNGVADDPSMSWDFHADADGDGFGAAAVLYSGCEPPVGATADSSDCDDTVAEAHPGGIERYAWGIDYDCDGDLLVTDTDAVALLQGGDPYDAAGSVLAGDFDLDGDGLSDLAVAAPGDDGGGSGAGAVHVLLSASGRPSGIISLDTGAVTLLGVASGDGAGSGLAPLGDVDGDGLADLAIGAPYNDDRGAAAGAVYLATGGWVVSGPTALVLSDVPYMLYGEQSGDGAGLYVAAAGDVGGDSDADLLVGASAASSGAGTVYLVSGPFAAETDLSLATAAFLGEASADGAGPAAGGGDLDGDGLVDLVIGAPGSDAADTDAGRAYVLFGELSGVVSLTDADLVLDGVRAHGAGGAQLAFAGDCDGDGTDDLLIGAPGGYSSTWTTGEAYLFLGSTLGAHLGEELQLDAANAIFTAEGSDDGVGWSFAAGGDVDGDGVGDFLIGAPLDDAGASDGGAIYLRLGPAEGTETLATAWIKVAATSTGSHLGTSLTFAGDLDGDTLADFLGGAPADPGAGTSAGAAWLFLGGDL